MRNKFLFLLASISLVAVACNGTPHLRQDGIIEIKAHKYAVQIADTPDSRYQGLSGVPRISDTEGMLFLFSEPQQLTFVMRGMLFPLDIIWIDGNTIVGISDNAPIEKGRLEADLTPYNSPTNADKVLEVNAGWALRHDIKVGDTLTITRNSQP